MKYYVERHPWVPRRKTPESKEERKLIEINGCSLHVQQNLYDFLQDFRSATFESSRGSASQDDEDEHSLKSPPIWIDAICINQDDLQERASQVLWMGRIFRSASRVLAWLGPPDSFTDDAIHGLDTLFHSDLGLDPGNVTIESFPGIDLIHWVAIFAFFQPSWFRRAWVTQEVAFGRERLAIIHGGYMRTWHWLTIVCVTLESSGLRSKISKLGYSLLTGAPLSDGNRRLRVLVQYHDDLRAIPLPNTAECLDEGQDGVAFISSVRAVLWRLRENGNDLLAAFPPLLRVLQLFRGTQATDPRDKVFAFLNLALDKRELGLVPDYHASVQSVFRNTTEMIMKTTKSLSILSHVQEPGDTRIEHLPGWVPDFSAWLRYTPLDTGDDDVVYCASGPGTAACFEVLDDGTLRIQSIRVDEVITCLRLDGDFDDRVHSVLKAVLRVPHWYPVDNFKTELENFNDDTWWNFPTEEIKWTSDSETKDKILDEHDETDEDIKMCPRSNFTDEDGFDASQVILQQSEEATEDLLGHGDGLTSLEHDEMANEACQKESNVDLQRSGDPLPFSNALAIASNPSSDNSSGPRPPEPSRASPDIPNSSVRQNTGAITRIEALWRSLVGDALPHSGFGFRVGSGSTTYPAPESLGRGFSNWILAGLLEMFYSLRDLSSWTDDKENPITEAAVQRLFGTLAVWGALYEEVHIPLVRDTLNFNLKVPDISQMAEMEREEAEGATDRTR
ncbi:HET domain-containing protein [Fusarium falciforme]|uniref:HET domain-containing protein n=1 Tax=Fusarium falciforme TaxID=195108 RepID=UPI0023016F1A|nr:HET domain-containing protein [Fusarium falciforme]WAO92363.1 HET domain-containing protein [Fusarium falciforme]